MGCLLRLAGLGYLLGVARSVSWTALLVVGVPFGGTRSRRRSSSSVQPAPSPGRSAGGGPRVLGGSGHADRARVGGGHRARRTLPRGVVPHRPAAEPAGVRRLGVLGAEGQGDLLLRRARRARLHDQPEPAYPPSSRSSTPRPSTRWAAPTSSPCTCSSGSSSSARSSQSPVAPSSRARPGCSGRPLLLVLVVPRFDDRLLVPQADVLVDVLFVVGALLLALWLRDRAGWRLAAAAVLFAGAMQTKREGCSSRLPCWSSRSPSRGPGTWPRLAVASLAVALARRSRGASGPAQHDISGEAPRRRVDVDRIADALRLSFDVLSRHARWSVVPSSPRRARRRLRLGRSAPRGVRRAPRAPASSAAAVVDGRLRGARSRRTRR